ncbi:phosphoethanolamine transferase domain-containing protein [Erwinia sp.]|uniref:phosphoethanolamine transferase domain-containing protein n=1 Tax=Erwinia citreus TaxID=558 RepID=UPI003C76EC64
MTLYAALFFTFIINSLFLKRVWESLSYRDLHDYLFAASLPVVLFSGFLFFFSLTAVPWLRKPLLILLLFSSAAANYASFTMGDLPWVVFSALIPAVFIAVVTIQTTRPWWMNMAFRAVIALGSLVLVLLVAALFYRDYASLVRNDQNLIMMITPANVISNVERYAEHHWFTDDRLPPAAAKEP